MTSRSRDFKDPKYIRWRKKVYARDKFTCQMPGCPHTDTRLNAHHIKRWASHPSLRFELSNGITLCFACHDKIHNLEEEYESLFHRIVNRSGSDEAMRLMMMRYGSGNAERKEKE